MNANRAWHGPVARFWLFGLLLLVLGGCAGQSREPVAVGAPGKAGLGSAIVDTARTQLGKAYCTSGSTPSSGFDCSGLVQWSFAQHGISLPRKTDDQYAVGQRVQKNELAAGDLVFFNISRRKFALHVGICTGPDRFIHSPSNGGRVREESLSEEYWRYSYLGARRIVGYGKVFGSK